MPSVARPVKALLHVASLLAQAMLRARERLGGRDGLLAELSGTPTLP